jgi:outer membrane protein assembly factor BamB
MPNLEIKFSDGRQQSLVLNKTSPITIGAQAFNDVCVPEDDVSPLHCRIGWIKTGFEVTAATPRGVDVNGTLVERAILKPGDVLRIGHTDILYDDAGARESAAGSRTPQRGASAEPSRYDDAATAESEPEGSTDDRGAVAERPLHRRTLETGRADSKGGLARQIASELHGARHRPGEQEILRSPTILFLSIGTAVTLLIALVIWFLMGREQQLRLFEQAENELRDGKYAQAIERYEEFLQRYPMHRLSRKALIGAGRARVQREISGATPEWDRAWEQLNNLVTANRNSPDYRDLQPLVRDFAEQIAIGSAKSAETLKDASLLEITSLATALMERSADPDTPQTGPLELIRTATERARVAIAKQARLDEAVAQMQAALTQKQPIAALSARAQLLRQFPEFAREPRVRQALERALAAEKDSFRVEDFDRRARQDDLPAIHAVTPAFHSRSRSEETSLGQTVLLVAQDALYAVDTVTGEPVWRRTAGLDMPFFPVAVRGAVNGWLFFDTWQQELMLCRAEDGKVIWRQSLEQPPLRAAPCVEEGQIYVSTRGGRIERLDLETGRHTARVQFSQELAGSPVMSPGKTHVFVAGERGLIYSVRRHPLECASITFTDHAPQAIRAPLLVLGRLLLVCENDRGESARLRLWDASQPDALLPEVGGEPPRIAGAVFEAPVLRGSQLVVSSSGERLAAFAVSDEPGRMGLAPIGQYRLQDNYSGPQYVTLGPDQQFWVSSSAFRRFEIAADSLRMVSNPVAVGWTAQPLQAVGETFFVARRPFFADAVMLTNIDRDRMTGTWRFVAGARPKVLLASAAGGATIVSDAGLVFRVPAARLNQPGIEFRSGAELEIPPELREAPVIGTLSDGRVAFSIAGASPKLWLIDAEGRVAAGPTVDRPAECPPLLLREGLLWPAPGRLQVKPLSGTQRYEDWRAPAESEEDEQPRWVWLRPLGASEFLGCRRDGVMRRFQVRKGDVPHVLEVASVQPSLALDIPPVLLGETLACATAERKLQWLDARTFDITAGPELPASVSGLWAVDGKLLAQTADHQLWLFAAGATGQPEWKSQQASFPVLDALLVGDSEVWVAGPQGQLVALRKESGDIVRRKQVPQALGLGVHELAGVLWAVAVDGTLYRVQDLPDAQP